MDVQLGREKEGKKEGRTEGREKAGRKMKISRKEDYDSYRTVRFTVLTRDYRESYGTHLHIVLLKFIYLKVGTH